ncbi:hypothetical protein NP234_24245, partial [Salmonella enterica]|nr:hypothetical protein [Salmonella enterica]
GKNVIFNGAAINRLYNLPIPPVDEVTQLYNDIDMNEVTEVICGRPVAWVRVKGALSTLYSKELTPDMKVWHHFLCARLVPTSHLTDVNKDRAVLLWAIKIGKIFNVGNWIAENISYAANNLTVGLPFPTLINELIAAAGIDTVGDEVLQPKKPLNERAIFRIKKNIAEEGEGAAGPSQPSRRPTARGSMANFEGVLDQLMREMEAIKNELAYTRQYQMTWAEHNDHQFQTLDQVMRPIAQSSGIDMTTLPNLAPFPDQLRQQYQPPQSSAAAAEDVDEDTEDEQ